MISIKNVKKIFKTGGTELEALGDVTFDVYPKEFVSIVGPSGCGKTTLLKIIAGLLPKSSGDIVVDKDDFDISREVAV
ncbi:MAG TPA: ATP-binding cassette domain-containing protein, partial [Rectinemataceae bacterium]|nr:ATP-binding cassette domain-containing protein [Rectinemataceae bacterium]